MRVETKRNLAVGSIDNEVRPFPESSDEESAEESAEKFAEKSAKKSGDAPHPLVGLTRAPFDERVIASNDMELQQHEENGFEIVRELDSTYEG